jgi:cold shock CspA family protein
MKYEVGLIRAPDEKWTIIVDVGDDEDTRAERIPGDAEAVRRGAALARAREFAPPGSVPQAVRRFNWTGPMVFELRCVNPQTRPNEQITIRRELTASQVAEASQSTDPVFAVLMASRPWPEGFMAIGGAASPLRQGLQTVMPNNQSIKRGTVRNYIEARGFGSIVGLDGAHYFYHVSAVAEDSPDPQIGDRVTFVVGTGRDGRSCANKVAVLPK